MQKSSIRTILASTLLACLTVAPVFAQQAPPENTIEGYSGAVQVIPNSKLKDTTIVLEMTYNSKVASKQIVFHLQQYSGQVPDFWTGAARILSGHNMLAVIPKDGSQAILFKFKEYPIPNSIKSFNFNIFPVFGIGYFGENTALNNIQIQQLANTGAIQNGSTGSTSNSLNLTPSSSKDFISQPDDAGPTNCVAGGPGATSCGAGGCTVTCGGGTYACCEGGTCTCTTPSGGD